MAIQKLQVARAIDVVPNDTIDIPDNALHSVSSTTTATTASKLVDSAGLFTTTNEIRIGDIVHNTTDGTITTVTAIDSATTLSLTDDIMAISETYSIYRKGGESCLLYVGVSGDIRVLTEGGDDVTYLAVPVGFMPVHVRRVFATSTTATNIIGNR